ncbi:MAG: TatD family hydrolase [Anaerolineales bacterium]|nr:TatD family hydrolase [Anaerolineales bacterium]
MQLTDTHCHLYWHKFDEDREAVIQRAIKAGVTKMLVPGTTIETSKQAIELAEKYPQVYAAVGVHPTDAETLSQDNFDELYKLAEHEKVIAIGEIGLDYYWVKESEKQKHQKTVFNSQVQIADALNKPLVIHLRELNDATEGPVFDDLFEMMEYWFNKWLYLNHPLGLAPGVLHSFNGNIDLAAKAIKLGFCLGVTGPVTYTKNESHREMIKNLPLHRLLIETDSPFLAPVPVRGKRNEPAFVRHIADKIAEIHSKSPVEIAEITSANAARLFTWGD